MSMCTSPATQGPSHWTVQYSGCNGQMKSKSFPSEQAAQQNVAQYGKGTILPPPSQQSPVQQAPTQQAPTQQAPSPQSPTQQAPAQQSPCAPQQWGVQYQGCGGRTKTKYFPTQEAAQANITQFRTGTLLSPGASSYERAPQANKYC